MSNQEHVDTQSILKHLNQIIETQSILAGADFDINSFMNLVVKRMEELTPATGVVIELVDGDEMVYKAATGTVQKHIGLRLKRGTSISGLCVASKEVLRSEDTEVDSRVNPEACRLVGARSLVVAPLFHHGQAIGVLKILSSKPSAFDIKDVQTLQLMAGLIGSALANQIFHDTTEKLLKEKTEALDQLKKAEEKLRHMAHYDYLTDLPNRSLFTDRVTVAIKKAKRQKNFLALLFLDIDHFKHINDTLGHAVGDELLKLFANRLVHCVRSEDTVARLGGDEFVILLDDIEEKNSAVEIAKKIINIIQDPFKIGDNKFVVNTSIGITYFNDKLDVSQFIIQADKALYSAKTSGRNTYKIYQE